MLTLAQALVELPDTADGIAEYLAERGHRGRRGSACRCPLASYFCAACGTPDITVGPNTIFVGSDELCVEAPTPEALFKFMRRFDKGEWPELVAVARA